MVSYRWGDSNPHAPVAPMDHPTASLRASTVLTVTPELSAVPLDGFNGRVSAQVQPVCYLAGTRSFSL